MNPGYGSTLSNDPTAILASSHGYVVMNVTVKAGEGEVAKGTVLGIETASGKYVKYDDAASDGSEVAKAIIADKVDATSNDQLVAVYIKGVFHKSKLTGYDANALTDLNGRVVGVEGGSATDIVVI